MNLEKAQTSTVLVFDDDKNIRDSLDMFLSQERYQVLLAHDAAAAMRLIESREIDVLILDIELGEIDGISFYKLMQSASYQIPTIFISGHASLSAAAQAVRIGGYDFVEKPFTAEKILVTVQRCLEFNSLTKRLSRINSGQPSLEIVGDSPSIRSLTDEVRKVAATTAVVLIQGESGTGKELIANALHSQSARQNQPFVKVNCSAIPENLIESELFGHERGAFTGAANAKRGYFEQAHRGTIFLDEVADLSLSAQAKILRVLQSGEIQKVGSEKISRVDVRVISGTHKNLKAAVADRLFREDLYYRFNVVPLFVPSLRERADDIPLLTKYFLKTLSEKHNLPAKAVDDEVFWELKKYQWPGNIRELQNVIERILILSGPRITVADLPDEILIELEADHTSNAGSTLKEFRNQAERGFIISALQKTSGNISQTASDLGIGRTYLHKRMQILGISKRDYFT